MAKTLEMLATEIAAQLKLKTEDGPRWETDAGYGQDLADTMSELADRLYALHDVEPRESQAIPEGQSGYLGPKPR